MKRSINTVKMSLQQMKNLSFYIVSIILNFNSGLLNSYLSIRALNLPISPQGDIYTVQFAQYVR